VGIDDQTRSDETRLVQVRLPENAEALAAIVDQTMASAAARSLLIGDLDDDGAPDLVLASPTGSAAFRRVAFGGDTKSCFAVSVVDHGDRSHALGAYVELWDGQERRVRQRWPPQAGGDQMRLWLTTSTPGGGATTLRVVWPDGNAQDYEARPGVLFVARRR
jgi:hypothetical protein